MSLALKLKFNEKFYFHPDYIYDKSFLAVSYILISNNILYNLYDISLYDCF